MSTAAAIEVLTARADNPDDSDIPRQLKALKEELDKTKREAAKAEKVISELKEEIAGLRNNRKGKARKRANVIESSSSSSDMDDQMERPKRVGARKNKTKHIKREDEEKKDGQDAERVEKAMEVDSESLPPQTDHTQERVYCDETRKKEILPPREEWPPCIRPPLKGKAKILEDCTLLDHNIKIVNSSKDSRAKENTSNRKDQGKHKVEKAITTTSTKGESPEEVLSNKILNRMTPLLEGWLHRSLETLGVLGAKGGGKGSKGKKDLPLFSQREKHKDDSSKKEGDSGRTTAAIGPSWSQVAGKKTIRPSSVEGQVTQAPQKRGRSATAKRGQQGKGRAEKFNPNPNSTQGNRNMVPTRRPPRTAAVVLTCPPDGYADAMRKTRQHIELKEIGIGPLKLKKAATGALILEIKEGKDKATALRDRMKEALQDIEGVRVSCPQKWPN